MRRRTEVVESDGGFRGRVLETHPDGETDERYETRVYPSAAHALSDAVAYLKHGRVSAGSVETRLNGMYEFH